MNDTQDYRVELRVPGAAGTIFIHVDNAKSSEEACNKATQMVRDLFEVEAFPAKRNRGA